METSIRINYKLVFDGSKKIYLKTMLYKDLNEKTREELKDYFQERDYMVIAVPKLELMRVYALRASKSVETARRIHALDEERTKILGEALLSVLLLTSSIKHATKQKVLLKLSLQDGVVVAEADGMGRVRGFIEGQVKRPWEGTLTVIKELRLGTPYTSIVPVVSDSMKENLAYYFEQSEQVKTTVDLSVLLDAEGKVLVASGYLLQVMGDAFSNIDISLEKLLMRGSRPEDIARLILKDKEPRLVGLKEVEYYCPCNEEIARSSLSLLEESQLEEILSEGPAEVVCKFCGRIYRFTKDML
ncbi:Hsp33 protein [Hydrogenobacter thermophilus TK-6]|nr:Hsp33 protein [Hydrogenobacter thermophilus TK-6]